MQQVPMVPNPLVSIAIVTWNRKDDLSKAIESCRNQTYRNIEIVVADNASSDGTYEFLLENHPDINVVRIHRNLGCCPGRNIAMANCVGDIVICLDDDGFLDEECAELIVTNFQNKEDVAVVACNVLDPHGKNGETRTKSETTENWYVPIFMGGGAGIRRNILDDVGYFPDYFRQGEENYLALKILDAGLKIVFEPAAIVFHDWDYSKKGRDDHQVVYLNFRHDLENIKRLLPLRYALPLMAYKIVVNLAKRYVGSGYFRYFIPDLIKVLPILITNYKENKIKINTYRRFTKEASKFFKERDSYNSTMPLSQQPVGRENI